MASSRSLRSQLKPLTLSVCCCRLGMTALRHPERPFWVDERRAQPDPPELGTRSPRPPFRSRRTNFFVHLPSLNNLFASDRNSAAR